MKTYFISLFNYDHHANELILQAINQAGDAKKAVQLMGHLLAAQQIWLDRCKGLPAFNVTLWPGWPAGAMNDLISQNSKQWLKYLESLQPSDFETLISYKNSKGDSFENKLSDVLAHVVNHSTHHRAQAGQHLKAAGLDKLPITDYIFYIRELNGNQ